MGRPLSETGVRQRSFGTWLAVLTTLLLTLTPQEAAATLEGRNASRVGAGVAKGLQLLGSEAPAVEALDLGPAFRGAHRRVLGIDGAFSLPWGKGRSLWVFGDTLLGSYLPDGTRKIADMPANSAAVVQNEDWVTGFVRARFVPGAFASGRTREARLLEHRVPTEVLKPAPRGGGTRLWPLDLARVAGRNWLYYVAITPHGTGPFDFTVAGVGVAPQVQGALLSFAPGTLIGGQDTPLWGSSVLVHGGYLYLYAGGAPTRVARMPLDNPEDTRALRYWNGASWVADAQQAAGLPASGPELSVRWNPYLKAFLMIYTPVFGRSIEARVAKNPEGPWGPARTWLKLGREGDVEALFYGAKQHAELDTPDGKTLVLSYNTNAPSDRLAARPDLYWPHLVRIKLLAEKTAPGSSPVPVVRPTRKGS